MTRKQAILAILAAPAGAITARPVADEPISIDSVEAIEISPNDPPASGDLWYLPATGTTSTDMWPTTAERAITIEFYDEPRGFFDPGFNAIEVHYNGQSKRFTATEIWEALQ